MSFMDKEKSKRPWKHVFHGEADGVLIRKCDSSPLCPNFGGDVIYHNIWRGTGDMSPPDYALQQTSVAGTVGFGFPYMDLIKSQTAYPLRLGRSDDIVGATYTTDPLWYENPWSSYMELSLFRNRTVLKDNGTFKKECVGEDHLNFPGPQAGQFVFEEPYFMFGRRNIVTINLTEIKNEDGAIKLRLSLKGSTLLKFGDTTFGPTPFAAENEIDLVTAGGVPRKLPNPTYPAVATRRMYESIESYAPTTDIRTKVRTQALINIDDIGSNTIENIQGFKGAGDVIKQLLEGYKAVKNLNPRAAIKFMADAYLIYQYVVMSTIHDVDKIHKKGPGIIRRLRNPEAGNSRRRAFEDVVYVGSSFGDIQVKIAAEYILRRNNDLESIIIDSLDSLGLLPSPGNLWDLVPLSFVVDWFTNLGSVFDALRAERDTWHYTILSRIESQKYQMTWTRENVLEVFGDSFAIDSPIDGKLYRRSIYYDWGSTNPMSLAGNGGLSPNQWFSGLVLIIQRKA